MRALRNPTYTAEMKCKECNTWVCFQCRDKGLACLCYQDGRLDGGTHWSGSIANTKTFLNMHWQLVERL